MKKRNLVILLFVLSSVIVQAQKKKKEQLKTEEITVVKPFSPTVSQAFKINIQPVIDSIDLYQKKTVDYTINSIPVASTFTPAKGRAKTLQHPPKERFYQNYISFGFGNYNTPIVDIFAHSNSSNYNDFGGFFTMHSSGGGIKDVVLDDSFSDTDLLLYYKQEERNFDWHLEGGFDLKKRNWYGLSDQIVYDPTVLESIDERQQYTGIKVKGGIDFEDSLFHKGDVSVRHFSDRLNSSELYARVGSLIDFPIGDELMYTDISLEFLSGQFKNDFFQIDDISYTYFNIGFSPNFEVLRDNLTLNLGARLYYSVTNDFEGSKFYAYPNVTASYTISDEALIAYAGVIGDLEQNSYRSFVETNPFVSPTLYVKRTNQQYNAYAGIKGLLNSKVRFNLKAAYLSEKDKPLFKLNPSLTDGTVEVDKGYEAANSFQVVYDDVNTIHFFGEIIFDLFEYFRFGGNIDFNSYSLSNEEQAWNLPLITSALLARYEVDKWSAGAELFFSSDRKDELSIIPDTQERITNAAYFDVNLNGVYHINDKFDVFLNVNNLLGSNYQVYTNFKVQGLQVLGGVTYKFDF